MTQEQDSLAEALARHTIDVPANQRELIDKYCRLLWEKNSRLNLTRHTDYETFVTRDVVDSTELAKQLQAGERVLDVGSGGGVPGILMSMLRPDLQVGLSECIGKKAEALNQMVTELGLMISVYRDRAENVIATARFDTLVGRAIGPLPKVLKWFERRWHKFGRLVLIKGPNWLEERAEARHRGLLHDLNLRRLASYPMPGKNSESVILVIYPKTADDTLDQEDEQ